ncbi:ATP-dependent DNA helicase [Pedobacter faecalis]|uniref:ATP-dependent DNA helicase n=1 Tax=Pedobacter faecalis TaxID=3041495 RepID=UPI0025507F3F|nr:AAA family ATPase [Pedobacter sp. ELA7]
MKLATKQAEFLKAVEAGRNVFLTGKAGTGKSFVVKEAMSRLRQKGKNVVALAPTGLAANNIGGQTLHSMFALDPFGVLTFQTCRWFKSEKRRLIAKIDVIFIDEVSMLRPDVLDAVNWTMVKNGCGSLRDKQIIFIGDLKQLPVVVDDNMRSVLLSTYDDLYFSNAKVFEKLSVQTIELDEILRQSDPDFIEALNTVRDGGKSDYFRQFVGTEPKGVILAPHNSTVQQYNVAGLSGIDAEEHEFIATVTGSAKLQDFNLESRVVLKDGCKIMYLVNSKNNNLFNGAIGTFMVDDGKHFIEIGEVRYALEQVELHKMEYVLNEQEDKLELREIGSITQIPVRLAYALSIHKSQGMTFSEVTVDLSRKCFAPGQMYVALSRVTGPSGLTIITGR